MGDRQQFLAKASRLATIGLMGGALLSLAAFGYFFYLYTLTGQRQFVSWYFALVYYGLPIFAAASLLASLRLAPTRRINLLLVCCAVGFTLVALEAALWFWSPDYGVARPLMVALFDADDRSREAARLGARFGVDVDARDPEEVLTELRDAGHEAVRAIAPNTILGRYGDGRVAPLNMDGQDVIPLAGVSNRLTVLCNENGQWITYPSDRHGFNNPDAVWDLESVELVAIGDSFAQGHCVPADRNFVALIRGQHPATLNLGMAGDGPLLMLATLKEYAPQRRPKLALWFYFEGNDLEELQVERRSSLLCEYLTGPFSQGELRRQDDVDRAILAQVPQLRKLEQTRRRQRAEQRSVPVFLRDLLTLSVLRRTVGLVGGMEVDDAASADAQTSNVAAFGEVLREAQSVVARWDGELIFVYLPGWEHYTKAISRGEERHDDVIAVARKLGLRTIDLSDTFDRHADPLSLFPFRRPGHYNEAGHRLVAETVLTAISRTP